MLRLICLVLALICSLPRIGAADIPVDIELVLAIDCSSSVDDEEFALQVAGMANAFRDPMIQEAIQNGVEGAIGVSIIQWSSERFQNVAVHWRLLTGPADTHNLANEIDAMPRTIGTGATSIANALLFAANSFNGNGMEGFRRVIDMSADGEKDYEDYRNAIFRKLFRELRDVPVADGSGIDPSWAPSWKEARLIGRR